MGAAGVDGLAVGAADPVLGRCFLVLFEGWGGASGQVAACDVLEADLLLGRVLGPTVKAGLHYCRRLLLQLSV